ncbi:MAG: glycosyltransferase [Flavobacterium nitrogenifigens]|uniref:Glycosyltransferase involved in cell wall bisynthesis n=1 Tax=Flavobacterium nitrogenifigens TaxID=1617283 RepID=A0A521EDJ2_9FLAO|nr:glycosyltransferase [Flavobacterium nitrogenifigens]KAF2325923.1 glycosyltransferase family 4 protein [Flavobacterium nitrogenifigens]MDQ8015097.1 glycosyltransferase [Flavobacterium nitrogenifigens]SMO81993.1 Glycosyltransferase involved in cell wall bisynthesis [Flavobacterium nitrogenifigens]
MKKVVISAVNLFEGGPLSVLKDCLFAIEKSDEFAEYEFVALVHKKDLFTENQYKKISFVEFPKSRKSYFYRLYYEYFYFKKFANQNNITFWFSLHDTSPTLKNVPQAVYCHNPSPFNTVNFKDIYIQPIQFFFRLFYKYLYKINIKKNKYVIVQQLWLKNKFIEMFDLKKEKIIVSFPEIPKIPSEFLHSEYKMENDKKIFFFPTFPRPFKNIDVICEASKILSQKNEDFTVVITIDGSENKYAKSVVDNYKNIKNINFIGLIKREEVYRYYAKSDCLIFPSKLETWGLPISEFKQFKKTIFVADLPYARETVGNYDYVNFFKTDDVVKLAELMSGFINDNFNFDKTLSIEYEDPFVQNWNELFQTLLK